MADQDPSFPGGPGGKKRPHYIVAAGLFALLALALLLSLPGQAATIKEADPFLRFDHSKHIAAEINCVFCHPGVMNGAVAGVPSLAKCVGCHQNIPGSTPAGQETIATLLNLWEEGQAPLWEKVNDQPDFVYFTHRPHIAAGVNCEQCHGQVGEMTMARPAFRLNMGFCLYCHRQQKNERLTECATCHK